MIGPEPSFFRNECKTVIDSEYLLTRKMIVQSITSPSRNYR